MVADQTLTVRLPAAVAAKIQSAAALTYRTIDDIVATTIDAALVEPPSAPADLAAEFAAMHLLSDQALQAAARPSISPAELYRLRQLNHMAGERSLTPAEAAEQEALLHTYQVSALRRAQALAILAQRGYDIPYRTALEASADDESFAS